MAIGRRSFLTGAGLLLAGGVRPAPAQSAWPARPVRFIVPLAAGGAIAPHILNLAYDYTKELLPVITITRQPVAFAVHPSLGVKSIAELVTHAKRNPGLGFASS